MAVAVAGAAAIPGAVPGAEERAASGASAPPAVWGIVKTRTMQKSECRYQKSEFPEGEGLRTRRGRSQEAKVKRQKPKPRRRAELPEGEGVGIRRWGRSQRLDVRWQKSEVAPDGSQKPKAKSQRSKPGTRYEERCTMYWGTSSVTFWGCGSSNTDDGIGRDASESSVLVCRR